MKKKKEMYPFLLCLDFAFHWRQCWCRLGDAEVPSHGGELVAAQAGTNSPVPFVTRWALGPALASSTWQARDVQHSAWRGTISSLRAAG